MPGVLRPKITILPRLWKGYSAQAAIFAHCFELIPASSVKNSPFGIVDGRECAFWPKSLDRWRKWFMKKRSFPIQACRNAIDGIRNEEVQQQPLVALRCAPINRRLIPRNRGTSGLYVINCRRW